MILYYIFYSTFYLISLLPWNVVYKISDVIFFLIYYLFRYRRKIVKQNIGHCFPEKNRDDLKKIEKKFYKNFVDNFLETIKFLSISDKEIDKRIKNPWTNIEALTQPQNPAIFLQGHLMNWEIITLVLGKNIAKPCISAYSQLSNPTFNRLMYHLRTKRKLLLINIRNFLKEFLPFRHQKFSLVLVADQNPPTLKSCFWLPFFNYIVPFTSGPEHLAHLHKATVWYFSIKKIKRGYFETHFELITHQAQDTEKSFIIKQFIKLLERDIKNQPENYLWSHNRFKYYKSENKINGYYEGK